MHRSAEGDPRATLERGIAEIDLATSSSQRDALLELAQLVFRWSARINLTGYRGLATITRRLVLDSVALVGLLPDVESLADLGSGAGFPGLPAAILRPQCRVTLVEARERRHHFQRAVCRALDLANVTCIRGRAEELEPILHAAVVAQALARPTVALKLMLPWGTLGAIFAIPGGSDPPIASHPRVRVDRIVRYRVPCGGPERSLWIGRLDSRD